MQLQSNYFSDYHNLKLTRDDKGVLVAEFHSNGGPFIMSAKAHTEFVDAFYRIAQDRANKIVILTGAGGDFITDVSTCARQNYDLVRPILRNPVEGIDKFRVSFRAHNERSAVAVELSNQHTFVISCQL